MTRNVEMACLGRHGEWDLISDYSSVDDARRDAIALIHNGHQFHVDDQGGVVFGITEDPKGGHYELRLWVDAETPGENTLLCN